MTTSTNEAIRAACEARGWRFKPWEEPPWTADQEESPWPPGTAGAASWPKARKLRAQILAELGLTDE
jgi:hypothetical protein